MLFCVVLKEGLGGHNRCETPQNSCISMSLEKGQFHTLPAFPLPSVAFPRVQGTLCVYVMSW